MTWPIIVTTIDDIQARVVSYDWPFARQRSTQIASHWQSLIAIKPGMYDGRVLLLNDMELSSEVGARVLRSAHFETDFAAFMAWRDFGFPDAAVKNCFSMAALRGNDGAFILAEMGEHTSNAGQIYFPAGTPDLADVLGDKLDLNASALRELQEETGLARHEVVVEAGWLLVDAGPRLACMKLMHVDAPALEVARDINARIAAQTHPELAGMRIARSVGDIDPVRMPDFIVAYLKHMWS